MTNEEFQKQQWDKEFGIDHNRTPVSDEQILEWLMEDEKREVEDNPDFPRYDPKTGF